MRTVPPLILIGALLTSLVTYAVVDSAPEPWLSRLLLGFLGLQWLGVLLVGLGARRFGLRRNGARLVLVTSVLTLPAGIPGALGARQALDELDRSLTHDTFDRNSR